MAETNDNFEEFLNKKKKKKSKLGKLFFALFVCVFFAGLIFVASDWALGALIHTRKEVPVPDLTQKPVSQALGLLAQQNLALKQAGVEFSPNVPPGSVLRQIPTAGSTVREGRVIRVWISEGDEMVFVPNTVGTVLRDGQLAIRQAGLVVEKVENAYSLTYEKGTILSQTPKADSLVQKGTGVALVLSDGEPPASVVLVPNFKGKKLAEATLWASTQDINLIIHEDENSIFPNGIIAVQRPAADTQIAPKSNVDITVSRRTAADNEKSYHLHYEMPQGKNANRVRVTVEDETGETEILNDMKQPGSKIDIEIPYTARATIRVFSDGILVREREVL
jgi:serine/threonine-protein kinase